MHRPCSISGPLSSVLQAQMQVHNLVVQERVTAGTKRGYQMQEEMNAEPKRPRTEGYDNSWGQMQIVPPAAAQHPFDAEYRPGPASGQWQSAPQPGGWQNGGGCGGGEVGALRLLVPRQTAGAVIGKQGSNLARIRQEAGAIIGKQGSTLKSLREQTGVNCQVEKQEIMGERLVTASGQLQAVVSLAGLVMSLLDK